MAILTPVILKNRPRTDGKYSVKIRLFHKERSCYLPTTVVVSENEWNGKVIKNHESKYLNEQIDKTMRRYARRIDELEDICVYTCTQLKNVILQSHTDPNTTFESFVNNFIDDLLLAGRKGTADVYRRHAKIFLEFMKGDIPLIVISPETIRDFGKYLMYKKTLKTPYTNSIMRSIKAIINRAQKERVVKFKESPFIGIKIPTAPIRECALSERTMNILRTAKIKSRPQQMARDLFMLSFYCGGMNFVDMLNIDWSQDSICYQRQKIQGTVQSGVKVRFTIPQQAKEIAKRWMTNNGKLHFLDYKYSDVEDFRRYVTKKLKLIEKDLNLQEHVMLYSARKSFAQFAADLGFPDAVIDYCLGHSPRSRGIISYYTQVRPQQADIVLRRVADYLEHPERYKDFLEMKYSFGIKFPEMN